LGETGKNGNGVSKIHRNRSQLDQTKKEKNASGPRGHSKIQKGGGKKRNAQGHAATQTSRGIKTKWGKSKLESRSIPSQKKKGSSPNQQNGGKSRKGEKPT